jgi:hypothetical protein
MQSLQRAIVMLAHQGQEALQVVEGGLGGGGVAREEQVEAMLGAGRRSGPWVIRPFRVARQGSRDPLRASCYGI